MWRIRELFYDDGEIDKPLVLLAISFCGMHLCLWWLLGYFVYLVLIIR